MKTFDNENLILENFNFVHSHQTILLGNVFSCQSIFRSIKDPFMRKDWIDSSGKDAPPPDFYNEKKKLMMDVMRLDDSSFVDRNGKVQNPIYKNEKKLLKEYFGENYKTEWEGVSCFVVASSGLPTAEDHNFERYFENFKRTFQKHNDSIDLYQKNHPGFKTIFFLFDESTAYVEVTDKAYLNHKKGDGVIGKPHFPFLDERFVEVIRQSKVDFVVWYMPYKLIQNRRRKPLDIPKCAILQNGKISQKRLIHYNRSMITSIEM